MIKSDLLIHKINCKIILEETINHIKMNKL